MSATDIIAPLIGAVVVWLVASALAATSKGKLVSSYAERLAGRAVMEAPLFFAIWVGVIAWKATQLGEFDWWVAALGWAVVSGGFWIAVRQGLRTRQSVQRWIAAAQVSLRGSR